MSEPEYTECQLKGCSRDGDGLNLRHERRCSKAVPVDYAALQKELSERKGCRTCPECVEISADFINPKVLQRLAEGDRLHDWEPVPWAHAYVHHCKDCREYNASQPLKWIADVDPGRFEAYAKARDGAWALDGLRTALPNTHPMFEKPRLGPVPDWDRVSIQEQLDKPADDGGGFRML
jgi:hypothetical protein